MYLFPPFSGLDSCYFYLIHIYLKILHIKVKMALMFSHGVFYWNHVWERTSNIDILPYDNVHCLVSSVWLGGGTCLIWLQLLEVISTNTTCNMYYTCNKFMLAWYWVNLLVSCLWLAYFRVDNPVFVSRSWIDIWKFPQWISCHECTQEKVCRNLFITA